METTNPLGNYRKLVWGFQAFQSNIEGNGDNLKLVNKLSNELVYKEIRNTAHIATQEIENLIFSNNNGADRLINSIKTDVTQIGEKAALLMKEYRFNNCDIMPKVIDYFDVMQVFWDFYDSMIKVGILKDNITQETEPSKQKPASKIISYKWQSNHTKELPELFKLLQNTYKLIASDTTLEQFEAIFTGQSVENIKPIKWKASNRLLAYFLDLCFNGQDWQSIAQNGKYFINKNGKLLNKNDLSVAYSEGVKYVEPNGYEKIDKILKEIKNIKNIKTS